MALKTFNLDEETYKKYSAHCKENGISMSKQVEKFIMQEVARIAGRESRSGDNERASSGVSEREKEHHSMMKYC